MAASSPCTAGSKGFYGGLDVGSTNMRNVDDNGTSFGGVVGYGFNRYVALDQINAGFNRSVIAASPPAPFFAAPIFFLSKNILELSSGPVQIIEKNERARRERT